MPAAFLGMLQELQRRSNRIGPGTLYPILDGLQMKGYLRSEKQGVKGKVRESVFDDAARQARVGAGQSKLRQLFDEIFEDDPD